jgi:hypothetical protein
MLTSPDLAPVASAAVAGGAAGGLNADLKSLLERTYGMRFTILDGASGELLDAAPGEPSRDWSICAEICREVARGGKLEFIDDEDPFLTLALPLTDTQGRETVGCHVPHASSGGKRGSFSPGESLGHAAR